MMSELRLLCYGLYILVMWLLLSSYLCSPILAIFLLSIARTKGNENIQPRCSFIRLSLYYILIH